uniref:Uncharacterized protein n=1 Tax=Rhizophora mucronata TaxID=61149 RepID=A0A2P2KBI1_RHIMU
MLLEEISVVLSVTEIQSTSKNKFYLHWQ